MNASYAMGIWLGLATLPLAAFAQQAAAPAPTSSAAPGTGAPAAASSTPAAAKPTTPTLPPLPPIDSAAFHAMESQIMPLKPGEIRQLHRDADAADRAASEPPRFVPRPVSSSMLAVLSPGSTPPVVRVFPNYVSAVLFIDESGNPLLIDAVDLPGGDASTKPFNVTWSGDPKHRTNGLTISPTQMYSTGNIVVHLAGVKVPVPVMLISGQREVDTQAGIRVAGVGSGLPAEHLPGAADAGLQAFLDGVPPKAAKAMTTSVPDVQVWRLDDHFVVRAGAERTLTSPAWLDKKSSPDGTTVYVVGAVSPLVMLTDGQTISVQVSGY